MVFWPYHNNLTTPHHHIHSYVYKDVWDVLSDISELLEQKWEEGSRNDMHSVAIKKGGIREEQRLASLICLIEEGWLNLESNISLTASLAAVIMCN